MNIYSLFAPSAASVFPSRLAALAETFLREGLPTTTSAWQPAVDVTEDAEGYLISADLAGVAPGDVKVVVREGVLTLQGERKPVDAAAEARLVLSERSFGAFARSFAIPRDADGEKVTASFAHGAITIRVPRKEEVKPREVEVRVH